MSLRSHTASPIAAAASHVSTGLRASIRTACLALLLGVVCHADDTLDPAALLQLTEVTADEAARIVAAQSARPRFSEPADDAELDEQLLAAGATPQMIRTLRRDLAESRPFESSRIAQFLARTDSPRWQKVANSFADYLHLPRVTTLTPDTARALAEFPDTLCLCGITKLEPAVAESLASGSGSLLLYGVTDLTPEVAAGLSSASALGLRGLKSLSADAAKELVAGRMDMLNLSGIEVVTPELAAVLSTFKGTLLLDGVTEMSGEVATAFADSPARLLGFSALREVTVPVAEQLARFQGDLVLGGISTMTPEMVEALAQHEGHIVLRDMTVRVPEMHVTPDALEALVVDGSLHLPAYKVIVADSLVRLADSRLPPTGQAQRKHRSGPPAKTAGSVTEIMDSPEDYVDGTYTVSVWIDTFWLKREKKILKDGTEILDGYCLQIKDGTRDAGRSESLGDIALSLDELVPVIRSKDLARGLQDVFPNGTQYRLDATVTISRHPVVTTNMLDPKAPPREAEYLLMDITRLEARRPDGSVVAVDATSGAQDFAALRSAFDAPREVAAAPARPAETGVDRGKKPPAAAPGPATPSTAEATAAAWSGFFTTILETGARREGETESARMARELIRVSQIPLENVDPAFANEITALIDLQRERMEQCKQHEREIAECDRKWAAKFAEMEQMAGFLGSQARSVEEAQQAAAAVAILGGAQLTQERNAEVAAMNERWANVYAAYDKRSAVIFGAMEGLQPVLEKKYQRRFVLP